MSQTEGFADGRASAKVESQLQNDESTPVKLAREAYVFGVGTLGGAMREAVDSVVEHPKETSIKLAESVALGGVLAASQLGPMPVKILGRVAAAGLGISFFADTFSPGRWERLTEVASDTWSSGANTERNMKIVQGSLGHLVFDSAFMLGGAKLGTGLVGKGIDLRYGTARSETVLLKDLPAAAPELTATETFKAGASLLAPDALLRTEPTSTNPAEKFNHSAYKFVPGKMAAVEARTFNGNSIGFSNDGNNKLIGDTEGNVLHMQARKGATPAEVAHLVMTGGFTDLIRQDALAWDAARTAAIDGSSLLSKKSIFQEAALGSQAYVGGQPGNAYTAYLRGRFGEWTPRDSAWSAHILTDTLSPESPWNASYVPATEALFSNGLPITVENRAADTNAHVMSLPMSQRKTAIAAVGQVAHEIASNQYPAADPMVQAAAIGKIAPAMKATEVEAARAILAQSGSEHLNLSTVQSVARLVETGIAPDAARAYAALQIAATTPTARFETVAPRATGNSLPQPLDVVIQPDQAGALGAAAVQRVDVRVIDISPAQTAAGAPAPQVEPGAAAPTMAAEVLLSDMRAAGFAYEQLLDPATVSVAKAILRREPQLLPIAAETARILPAHELSVSSVHTVQAMIDAGWNVRTIQRADVWAAQAIVREGGYPTGGEVRKLRLDERFQPRPDVRVPPAIVQ